MTAVKPLTVAQLKQIPIEKRTLIWPTPVIHDHAFVGTRRGYTSLRIEYKIFGSGPKTLLFLCGHGDRLESWHRYMQHFGGDRNQAIYRSIFINHRYVGLSTGPPTLCGMLDLANDAIEVLDHLRVTGDKSVHLVGFSMGAMCALQIASLAPDRVKTLTILAGTSDWWRGTNKLAMLGSSLGWLWPKGQDAVLDRVKGSLASQTWLLAPDEQSNTDNLGPFPTNGDRWTALWLLDLKPAVKGAILHAPAAVGFKLDSEALSLVGERIGQANILVVHGIDDKTLPYINATTMCKGLGVEPTLFEGAAHMVPMEKYNQIVPLMESMICKEVLKVNDQV